MVRAVTLVLAFILIFAGLVWTEAGADMTPGMIFYVGSNQAIVSGEIKPIDNSNANVISKLKENRAFLPLRFISENSGGQVEWIADENKAVITFGSDTIEITNGSDKMIKNGKEIQIDVSAFEENARLYIPVRAVSELIGKFVRYERGLVIIAETDAQAEAVSQGEINKYIMRLTGISVVGDKETFDKLVSRNIPRSGGSGGGGGIIAFEDSVQMTAPAAAEKSADFSETNTQTEGVDEADIIKTDGTYIYKIANNKLFIVQANPAAAMQQLSALEFTDFNINDMYIDGDKFVLIGSSSKYEPTVIDSAKPQTGIMPRCGYYYPANTEVRIYNIADRKNPVLERSVILEGNLITTRKIDGSLYVVSNKNAWYGDIVVPFVKDGDKEIPIEFSKMYYFSDDNISDYLIVSGIDIEKADSTVNSNAFLGSGNTVYVSQENMYITTNSYPSTEIYKFAISGGDIQFLSKGKVEGTVKDQFSMDEYGGYFRIATTSYNTRETNNVYIFNQSMQETGKITDIAPGERIYSVRYTGNTGYMVTFRQVDPLFVIDLNPENPKILGQLKIPGYSEYMHPYKEGYVIGFGKDASLNGLYKGLKIALFDATDPVNPKELFVEYIGDRGTNSPVLGNHKALMIMPELDMFALPIDLYEVEKTDDYETVAQGMFQYQGGFVYKLSIDKGFALAGKITHLSDEEYLKAGAYGGDANKYIDRLLYIDGAIYSSSNQYITAHDAKDFTEISKIELK